MVVGGQGLSLCLAFVHALCEGANNNAHPGNSVVAMHDEGVPGVVAAASNANAIAVGVGSFDAKTAFPQ